MKKQLFATLITIALAAGANAQSLSLVSDMGVSLKGGTAGFGVDLTKKLNDKFKVRLGYSTYDYSDQYTQDQVTYDGTLKLGGWNLLGDWHLMNGGFRVTGGVYSPRHELAASGRFSGGSVTINGVTYTPGDLGSLSLESSWGGVRPYLGVGYDGFNSKSKSGVYFTADAGVIVSGSPKVRLNASCLNPALCSSISSDLAAEETKINNDLKGLKVLPVVQVGVGYRF